MHNLRKYLSSSFFGVIVICFFAPFIEVSCNKVKITNPTGWQFLTGHFEYSLNKDPMTSKLLEEKEIVGRVEDILKHRKEWIMRTKSPYEDINELKNAKPNILLLISFTSAIIGLLSFMFKWNRKSLILVGVIGFISDIIFFFEFKSKINQYIDTLISENSRFSLLSRMVNFDYTIFYYLTIVIFILVIGFNIYCLNYENNPFKGKKFRQCPFCAENIKAEAIICRYCHKESVEPIDDNSNPKNNLAATNNSIKKRFRLAIKTYFYPVLSIAILSMIIFYLSINYSAFIAEYDINPFSN